MRTIITAAVLALCSLHTAAQRTPAAKPQPVQTAPAGWLSYTDKASGISVKYPAAWNLKTTNPKSPVVLHSPSEGEGDVFTENINYITRELPAGQKVTLNDIATAVRNGLTGVVDDFMLEYEKKLRWTGSEAVEFAYTGTSKGEFSGAKVRLVQRITLTKGYMLLATYTAENGKTDVSLADALRIIDLTVFKK